MMIAAMLLVAAVSETEAFGAPVPTLPTPPPLSKSFCYYISMCNTCAVTSESIITVSFLVI